MGLTPICRRVPFPVPFRVTFVPLAQNKRQSKQWCLLYIYMYVWLLIATESDHPAGSAGNTDYFCCFAVLTSLFNCHSRGRHRPHWRIQGGARDYFIFMQFSANTLPKNIFLPQTQGFAPLPVWVILDQPLVHASLSEPHFILITSNVALTMQICNFFIQI